MAIGGSAITCELYTLLERVFEILFVVSQILYGTKFILGTTMHVVIHFEGHYFEHSAEKKKLTECLQWNCIQQFFSFKCHYN